MAVKQNDPSFLILSTHRIMFPHLDAPHAYDGDDEEQGTNEPKYSVVFLIPYNHPDAAAIWGQMQQLHAAEALSKFKGMPFDQIGSSDFWNPLRDGGAYADKMIARGKDPALYEPYRGHYFIKATSDAKYAPVVFKQVDGQPEGPGRFEVINIKGEIYGGCYCRGVLKGLGWNNKGKYGFSWFINSILKTAEGPKLGGFSASADDYDLGNDTTDRTALLPGEAGFTMPGAGFPAPGINLTKTPGAAPQMPAFGAPVIPAAQRPPLPGMQPQIPAFTPPTPQPYVPPVPQFQAPVYTPPAPVIAPIYNQQDGKTIVSFDNGVTWEWA
jgi:hypothetical protein